MGFKRWGFSGAQPQFQPEGRGLVDASKLLTFQVGDRDVRGVEQAKANSSVYRLDIDGIDCADARLIAAAPQLFEALTACRLELDYCQRQLAAHGQTGHANDSVSRALAAGNAALALAKGES